MCDGGVRDLLNPFWIALCSVLLSCAIIAVSFLLMWTMTIPRPMAIDACACQAHRELSQSFNEKPWAPSWLEQRTLPRCKVILRAMPAIYGSDQSRNSPERKNVEAMCSRLSLVGIGVSALLALSLGFFLSFTLFVHSGRKE